MSVIGLLNKTETLLGSVERSHISRSSSVFVLARKTCLASGIPKHTVCLEEETMWQRTIGPINRNDNIIIRILHSYKAIQTFQSTFSTYYPIVFFVAILQAKQGRYSIPLTHSPSKNFRTHRRKKLPEVTQLINCNITTKSQISYICSINWTMRIKGKRMIVQEA